VRSILLGAALGLATACAGGSTRASLVPATPAPHLTDGDVQLLASLLEAADTRRADTVLIDRALASRTPIVRAYAARAIGQNGMVARASVLRSLVTDVDSMIAADAAFALGLLRDSPATTVLATALSGPPTVAAAAAWSLGEIGSEARPALEAALRSAQPPASLADVLQATTKLRPVPVALVTPYLTHRNVDVRRSAVYALTRSRVPSAVTPLLALEQRLSSAEAEPGSGRSDAEVDLRSYLARGLARTVAGDSIAASALAALRRLVDDPHPHVRINAIRSLATYGPAARSDLVRHLRDPDANARIALAQSLGGVLGSTAGDWNDAWAADTGFTFRRALLSTAIRAGVRLPAIDPTSRDAWERRDDWRFRAAAAEAAGAGSRADVDAIVLPLLHDPDGRVRTAAYGAVAALADSASSASKAYSRDSLRTALADPDLFVRATILDALRPRARAADASVAIGAWRRAARDSDNDARLAALRVLAAAWSADSASFGALRDSLSSLAPPADPLERAVVRAVGPLAGWPRTGVTARPMAWYVDHVRTILARDVAGRPTRATIATARGAVHVVLFGADAPLTVSNFAQLARRGYYNGLAFHRVVPNFVAQDGDPRGDGSGGPGYAIRDELNRRWYDRGAVGMALSGPDTGGSQYFLAHSPQPHLDGHYTVFGHVTSGLEVLDSLVQGDRILSITIE
jgi:cyclophilin family peptidyl-prolyl cis-trans isomerase/HEAT repeat protein